MGLTNLVKTIPRDHETKEVFMNLSDYEDIFSDFDTKPLTHRSLSDDFLQELKKEVMDSSRKKVDLKLVMPIKKRNTKTEIIIKRRIEEYFRRRFKRLDQERKKLIRTGILLIIIGVIIQIIKYTAISVFEKYRLNFLMILLEPISWFLFWEGSYLIFFETKKNHHEYNFYKRISKAKIIFKNNEY